MYSQKITFEEKSFSRKVVIFSLFALILVALWTFFMARHGQIPVEENVSKHVKGVHLRNSEVETGRNNDATTQKELPFDEVHLDMNQLKIKEPVKVTKIWNDGSLSFKVGEDYVTVASDGTILYLPKEL